MLKGARSRVKKMCFFKRYVVENTIINKEDSILAYRFDTIRMDRKQLIKLTKYYKSILLNISI